MKEKFEVFEAVLAHLKNEGLPLVFSLPHQGFVLKGANGRWMTDCSVRKEAAEAHLTALGWTTTEAKAFLKSSDLWTTVYGFDLRPNEPDIFMHNGAAWLNTWVPSTVVPKEGAFPTIEGVLEWVSKADAHGAAWLVNWMAYKYQNQLAVPKVAVVLATAPGAGKGFIARVFAEILGPENCAIVKQSELENKFNSRWIGKIFVFGDEVISTDNTKDISNKLKVYIDGNVQELEAKGVDQIQIKSKLAWMFASNDRVSPVIVESNDRRYSFYANHEPMSEEYKQKLQDCFELDRVTYTESFAAEIAAFAHYLSTWKVDKGMLVKPLDNEDRAELIEANKPSFETFFDELERDGVDAILEDINNASGHLFDSGLPKDRADWDFGDEGIFTKAMYALYKRHAKASGSGVMKIGKFGAAIKNRGWKKIQLYRPKKKTVRVYVPPAGVTLTKKQ